MALSFEDALRLGTGLQTAPEKWQKTAENRARVTYQTDLISARLERQGVPTWCAPQDEVTVIGELSHLTETVERKRRHLMLLPEVAKADRAGMVRDLTYFLQRHRLGGRARYAVVTSGQRVPYHGDLRGRRRTSHANLSRWAYDARRMFGVELLYRGDENTFNDDGAHFHMNIVYWPTRYMSKSEFARFLAWSKQRLGGVHWRDCGKLEDVREVVKYICKLGTGQNDDAGSWGLDNLDDDQLLWYHEQTFKAQHIATFGAFADFRRDLQASGERIARVRGRLVRVEKCVRPPVRQDNARAERGKVENMVIARQLPSNRFGPVAEPCLMVMGYNPNPKTAEGKRGLEVILSCQAQSRNWAQENDALNVHTRTITLQPELCAPVKMASDGSGEVGVSPTSPGAGVVKRRYRPVRRVIVRPEPRQKRLFHRPDGTVTPMRRVVIR